MHLGFCAIYLGRVHTETFSCVLVLFQVMCWLLLIPLRTVNNTNRRETFPCVRGLKLYSITKSKLNNSKVEN